MKDATNCMDPKKMATLPEGWVLLFENEALFKEFTKFVVEKPQERNGRPAFIAYGVSETLHEDPNYTQLNLIADTCMNISLGVKNSYGSMCPLRHTLDSNSRYVVVAVYWPEYKKNDHT